MTDIEGNLIRTNIMQHQPIRKPAFLLIFNLSQFKTIPPQPIAVCPCKKSVSLPFKSKLRESVENCYESLYQQAEPTFEVTYKMVPKCFEHCQDCYSVSALLELREGKTTGKSLQLKVLKSSDRRQGAGYCAGSTPANSELHTLLLLILLSCWLEEKQKEGKKTPERRLW